MCLKFNLIRFGKVFQGPQNDKAQRYLGIVGIQGPPGRVVSDDVIICFLG